MAVDDLLHHGQAHAKAAALAVATGVGAPEAREHHAGLFLSKADAGVAHGDGGHDVALLHRHRDVAALRRVAHGIGDEVGRGLADHISVAHYHNVGLGVVLQGEAGIGHEHLVGGDDARDELADVDDLLLHGLAAVFQTRQLQQRIHQPRQALDLGIHGDQALLIGLVDAIDHGLHRGLDGHERGAQLVGNIGGEAPLQIAVLLHRLGHDVEGLAEARHLVLAGQLGASRQIAVADGPGRLHDAVDR